MIVADILQIATDPVKSTYIQYMANLSFEQLSAYTRMLQQRGLIEKQKDKTWLITERGKEYLLVYSRLQRILDHVEPTTFSSSEEDNSSIRG
jgi:predicted transcriptional regulator